MRFRNYVNSYNRRNRIYSEDDIWQMNLEKLFANEPDIMAQNSAIGIPTVQELEQSPNTRMLDVYSIYGDNAEAVARWEAALDDIAEAWDSMREPKDNRQKYSKDSNDDEDDDSENSSQPSPPSEPQEDKSGGETSEEESSEESHEESKIDSAEHVSESPEVISKSSAPLVLEGKVEENVDLGEDIPNEYNTQSGSEYEKFFPLVYDKTVAAKQSLQESFKESRLGKIAQKYEGLDPGVALQKAASKLPVMPTEIKYYGISSNLGDGDKQNRNVLEENSFYKLKDIKDENLRNLLYKKAAKMYKLDPNSLETYDKLKDTDIVMPKLGSELNKSTKKSEALENWVAEHYGDIKNQ